MEYRREIDGLRALAVVPVMLFHAGFQTFSGGFVGVDVFFVISGYLITTIILSDLQKEKFSLLSFYERRARRIIPALFLVMAVTFIFAYAWMMPDEFKNFGQSLVATTFFANNVLLAFTSGYWALASDFKPLLHTWSLGVEEQYYVIFPLFMLLGWRYFSQNLIRVLGIVAFLSFIIANWWVYKKPDMTFYILPTRAWEILLGSFVAFYLNKKKIIECGRIGREFYSLLGFLVIIVSIIYFNHSLPNPSFYTLAPTLGAVLIILFALPDTIVGKFLASKLMVGVGLISYSLYLWHQPLLAFSRIYLVNKPTPEVSGCLIILCFFLAYFTWRFVETPCRNKTIVSRNLIFSSIVTLGFCFVLAGLYLNKEYGIPARIFDASVKIEDMDKRIYNERVFKLKKDYFAERDKLKILVIGNSFGRDFVNMTTETFNLKYVEIVYRDDLAQCILPLKNEISEKLYNFADIIVFAGVGSKRCMDEDIEFSRNNGSEIFYVGSKEFGWNLNWLIRLDHENLPNQYNPLLAGTLEIEKTSAGLVPNANYISLLMPIVKDGQVPVTDGLGRLLSTDRIHLTKYGAIFIGDKSLRSSRYGAILNQHSKL
jgi:peptidoglycan/LPS O-acetylase OafA/YrhL